MWPVMQPGNGRPWDPGPVRPSYYATFSTGNCPCGGRGTSVPGVEGGACGVRGTLGHLRGAWGEGCRVHVRRLKDPSIGSLSKEAWGLGSSVRGVLPLW